MDTKKNLKAEVLFQLQMQELVRANCPYLKVGERLPNLRINGSENQLKFA